MSERVNVLVRNIPNFLTAHYAAISGVNSSGCGFL
jgi:hypothetical protein